MEFATVFSIFQAFVDFFTATMPSIVREWWALPLQKQIGSLLGFIVAVGTGLHSLQWLSQQILRTRARFVEQINGLRATIERQENEIETLRTEIAQQNARILELSAWLPATARKAAERERRDGNDSLEAQVLSQFISKIAPDIAAFSRKLVEFHIGQSFENPKFHLDQARHFTEIAALIQPNSGEGIDLSREVERLRSEFQVTQLQENSNKPSADVIGQKLGIDVKWSVETKIDYLRQLAFLMNSRGLQSSAALFMNRAALYCANAFPPTSGMRATTECWAGVFESRIGRVQAGWTRFEKAWPVVKESLGERSIPALDLKFYRAEMLESLDQNARALDEVESLLVIQREVHSEHYSDVVTSRWLRAKILCRLGRSTEALHEIDEILPLHIKSFGDRSEQTLGLRWLRAMTLRDLARYTEALKEVESLLPLQSEAFGERHPDTLAYRWLRGSILRGLDRNEEALAEIEGLLSIEYSVLGSQHPHTIAARVLRAMLLNDLERSDEAIGEIEGALAIRRALYGERHPETLSARYNRAVVIAALGRYEEALNELSTLLPVVQEVMGDQHRDALACESLRLGVLVASGQARPALADLQKCLEAIVGSQGENASITVRTRYRLARARLALGHTRAARSECNTALASLQANQGMSQLLLSSVRALSARIDGAETSLKLVP